MPTAICPNGHVTHWRGVRGASMPERCETCDQPNGRARGRVEHDADGRIVRTWYEPVPARPKRTTITCFVCGTRRQAPGPNVQKFDEATAVTTGWLDETTVAPAGAWVCWHHKALKDGV